MNVDAMLGTWSASELGALDRWRQGHLVQAAKTPWVSVRSPQVSGESGDAVGKSEGLRTSEESDTELRIMVDPGASGTVPYVVVISQTCDVVGTGPGARHPFVQVCPIRDVSGWSADRLAQLRRGELNGYVYLTAPPQANAQWALDLRMSWPLAKEVLIQRAPIKGFATFEDEREIGVQLALKYQRPALPDVLSKTLPDAIRASVKAGLKQSDWADEILQIRLQVMSGTELEPKDVRIIVVSDSPLSAAEKKHLKAVWNGFKRRLREAGIEWASPSFQTLDRLSARVYRDSVLMNIPELHTGSANRP